MNTLPSVPSERIEEWRSFGIADSFAIVLGSRSRWSAVEILDTADSSGVSPVTALWLVLREDFIESETLHEFIRWCDAYSESRGASPRRERLDPSEASRAAGRASWTAGFQTYNKSLFRFGFDGPASKRLASAAARACLRLQICTLRNLILKNQREII